MLELWSRIANRIGRQVDRLIHSRARRQARDRTIARAWPAHVVVVCYGNICRSPFAAACLRRQLEASGSRLVQVDSAGFIGPGRPANQQGAGIALEFGLDLSNHRSRLIRDTDARHASLLLVMTKAQREQLVSEFGIARNSIELLGDFDTDDPPYREIPDPYGKPDSEFRRVFAQIQRSADGLCSIWAGTASAEHPANHP